MRLHSDSGIGAHGDPPVEVATAVLGKIALQQLPAVFDPFAVTA